MTQHPPRSGDRYYCPESADSFIIACDGHRYFRVWLSTGLIGMPYPTAAECVPENAIRGTFD